MANQQRGNRIDFRNKRDIPGPTEVSQFRFLVPTKAATIIIGKGGERVQRLTVECNCRLTVVDSGGPERVFMIEGVLESCLTVWAQCFPDLREVMGARGGDEADLRFLCHNSIVGAVIGKAGSKVKEYKANHGLSVIKVHQEMAPMSTDRVIQMVGPAQSVLDCFRTIYSELAGLQLRGPIDNYCTDNCDERMAAAYGGWPGRALEGDMGPPDQYGGQGFPPGPGHLQGFPPGPGHGPMYPQGPPRRPRDEEADWGGRRTEEWPLIGVVQQGGPPRRQYGGEGPPGGKRPRLNHEDGPGPQGGQPRWYGAPRQPMGGQQSTSSNQAHLEMTVTVPAASLAGLNEERLHNIMEDSGARVSLLEAASGSADGASLAVSGSKDQVDGAHYLLQMSVKRTLLNL